MFDFGRAFLEELEAAKPKYLVRGIITDDEQIYPLGSDTKVLSTIFESFARPLIYRVASKYGYDVEEPEAQNCYPDFTLLRSADDTNKIAVDVKTTYRRHESDRVSFTLGGYKSFLRSETRGILYPFSHYEAHWIIGYIYTRRPHAGIRSHVYPLSELAHVPAPYDDVQVFVQEKWRIAGDVAGSGNTTNIGSIRGTLTDFAEGRGVFNSEAEFLDYWRNYGRSTEDGRKLFSNVKEYREWRAKNPL